VRRLPTTGAILAVLGGLLVVLGLVGPATTAGAQSTDTTTAPTEDATTTTDFVAVVKVSGLLDPVLVDFVMQSVADAESQGATALILQANSTGVVVSDAQFTKLLERIGSATIPVDVWVGPSGSHLTGKAAQLVGAADKVGMAPGTRLGDTGPPVTDTLDMARIAPIVDRTVNAQEAKDLGITTFDAPTIGDFLVNLPEVKTRQVTADNGETRLEPVTQVRFGQLSLLSQLFHTVASPAVAYLLLAVGLALIVFELFTAGVGVAGVVGAGSFILAGYGLGVLPIRWWGVALIGLSMLAFAIDVQTGVPRFWTGAGFVMFAVGSFTIYDGFSLSWVTLVVAFVGLALTFLAGMPSMVRTRFSTPTIGREWMVGELGRAVTSVNPDGVVQIRDALWRASTNRATPIDELDRVRVTGIDGLVLEVEPEEGGARDYRDRSPRTKGTHSGADTDADEPPAAAPDRDPEAALDEAADTAPEAAPEVPETGPENSSDA
jgi:membrane-bound serine protease (ClpP class)